jgi:hypothetical protein
MAKRNESGLFSGLTKSSSGSRNAGLSETTLSRPSRSEDGLMQSAEGRTASIQFGSPSLHAKSGSTTTSGSEWATLLKQTAEHGIVSAVSGFSGGVAATFGPIGSLISGVAHLFGGGNKKTTPSLQEFALPASQDTTAYVRASGTTVYDGSVVLATGGSNWTQDQSAQIAQAVKTAMLHSSSLNDVIAEL